MTHTLGKESNAGQTLALWTSSGLLLCIEDPIEHQPVSLASKMISGLVDNNSRLRYRVISNVAAWLHCLVPGTIDVHDAHMKISVLTSAQDILRDSVQLEAKIMYSTVRLDAHS